MAPNSLNGGAPTHDPLRPSKPVRKPQRGLHLLLLAEMVFNSEGDIPAAYRISMLRRDLTDEATWHSRNS